MKEEEEESSGFVQSSGVLEKPWVLTAPFQGLKQD